MPSLLLSWDFCRLKRIYYGWTLITLLSCLTSHDAHAQNVYTPAPHGRWITGTQTAFNPTTGQIIGTWQLGFTPCDTSGNPLPYNYDDGMSSAMNNGILAEAGLENQVSYINNDNSLNMTGQIFFQSLNSHYTVPTVRLQDNQPTSIGSYPTQTPWNQMLDGGILYDGYDSGNMGRMPNGDILLLSNGVMANNYYLPFGAPAAAINGNLSDILSVNFQGSYRWDPNFTPAPGYTGPEPIKPIPPTTLSLRIMPMGWYDFSQVRTDIDYSMTRCKLQIDDSLGNLYWYGNPFWTGAPNWEHQPPSQFVYFPNADLVQAPVDPVTGIATVSILADVFGDVTNTAPLSQYGQVINYVTGQYQASILPDTRAVTISCPSIEANYHVGPLDPVTNTYPKYTMAADGSMQADSVVVGTINGHWKNGAGTSNSLIANPLGFIDPYYFWTQYGPGIVDSQTASSLDTSQQFLSEIPMNLDFGTEPSTTSDPNTVVANNPFPITSMIKVAVTNGPNTDGATAANTYTTTYHLPFENPAPYGPEIPADTPLQTVTPKVNTLTIIQIPSRIEAVDLADGAHIAGGVATAISAGLPLIKVVAHVTEPDLIVAQTIFATFGYTLGLAPDAIPETDPIPVATDYAEFKADVIHQVAINKQPVGQKDQARFDPLELAEIVAAQLQANNADWQKDPYFWPDPTKHSLSVSSQAFRYAKEQQVVGDGYGINGYQGPKFHMVRAEGGFYTVTHWIYN